MLISHFFQLAPPIKQQPQTDVSDEHTNSAPLCSLPSFRAYLFNRNNVSDTDMYVRPWLFSKKQQRSYHRLTHNRVSQHMYLQPLNTMQGDLMHLDILIFKLYLHTLMLNNTWDLCMEYTRTCGGGGGEKKKQNQHGSIHDSTSPLPPTIPYPTVQDQA